MIKLLKKMKKKIKQNQEKKKFQIFFYKIKKKLNKTKENTIK